MAYNVPMCTSDKDLISYHGGPAPLSVKLGYSKSSGGVQRVHNWLARGIPSKVKLERQDLFGPRVVKRIESAKDVV